MLASRLSYDKISLPELSRRGAFQTARLSLVPKLHLGTHTYLGSCTASAVADIACEGGTFLEAQLRNQARSQVQLGNEDEDEDEDEERGGRIRIKIRSRSALAGEFLLDGRFSALTDSRNANSYRA
jgi:hypothetical protein